MTSCIFSELKVIVTSGDCGGAEVLAPVIKELLLRGHDVDVFVSQSELARAGDVFSKNNLSCRTVSSVPEESWNGADVFISSEDQKCPELNILSAREARRRGVKSIVVKDFYKIDNRNLSSDPDMIFVSDNFMAKSVLQNRPLVPPNAVKVVGDPRHGIIKSLRSSAQKLRQDFLRRHCLGDNCVIVSVFLSSSLEIDPIPLLEEVCSSLLKYRLIDIKLVVRFHPTDPERERLARFVKEIAGNLLVSGVDESPSLSLAALSDIVIGHHSTVLMNSVFLDKDVLFVLTDVVRGLLEKDGLLAPYFPCLDYGKATALAALAIEEIGKQIGEILVQGTVSSEIRQNRKSFVPEERVAERIVDTIETVV